MNLLLIDVSNLLYRYYFAMPPLYSPKARMQTHVIYGWINFLLEQYQKIPGIPKDVQPIAFFDGGYGDNMGLVEGYKENRDEKPELLETQLFLARTVVKLMGVPYVYRKGAEADHLLGSFVLNKLADESNHDTIYIFSSDKDMLQLVDGKKVFQVRARHNGLYKMYSPQDVMDDYGVPPEKIPSLLCLMGDKSDNIPNVPGVGEKTAQKLLSEYGTIENILNNLGKMTPKMRQSFEASIDQLPKTMQLVSFSKDHEFSVKSPIPNPDKLIEFCLSLDIQKPLAKIYQKYGLDQ